MVAEEKIAYTVNFAEREVIPCFTLHQIGGAAFKRAQSGQRGWWDDVITTQLMCALTMEAVLNHVGRKVLEDASLPATWVVLERASPRKKLDAIAEHLSIQPDLGSFPFQQFGDMFKLRNNLAHARSVRLATTEIPADAVDDKDWLIETRVPGLLADWESMCDLETAREWRDSVYGMSEALCKAAGCIDPVRVGDSTSWSGCYQARSD